VHCVGGVMGCILRGSQCVLLATTYRALISGLKACLHFWSWPIVG